MLTSDRRSEEITALFSRRGARVMHAPSLRIVPLVEDQLLVDATRAVIDTPPDVVVVTTAIGFRGWLAGADAAGLEVPLHWPRCPGRGSCRGGRRPGVRSVRRGSVRSGRRAAQTTQEVVDHLLAEGVSDAVVAVQLHGATDEVQLQSLRDAGALVIPVPVYRWGRSPDPAAVDRSIEAVCARTVDAVVFTSAPGAQAWLDAADELGRLGDLVRALRTEVTAAAVGPVTAGPLRAVGVEPLIPDRGRLGALVRTIAEHLSGGAAPTLRTAAGALQVRGRSVTLDGRVVEVTAAQLAVLRVLARAGGRVVPRDKLLEVLPGAADAHAVEVVVARLRATLGKELITTIYKRGYRLAVVPA